MEESIEKKHSGSQKQILHLQYFHRKKTDIAGNINSCPERTDIKGGQLKNTYKKHRRTYFFLCKL
jgi:hypothetical protein